MIQYILVMLLYIPFSVIGQINNMNPCVLQCVTQAASQGGGC